MPALASTAQRTQTRLQVLVHFLSAFVLMASREPLEVRAQFVQVQDIAQTEQWLFAPAILALPKEVRTFYNVSANQVTLDRRVDHVMSVYPAFSVLEARQTRHARCIPTLRLAAARFRTAFVSPDTRDLQAGLASLALSEIGALREV
jgi:hypothetical protein